MLPVIHHMVDGGQDLRVCDVFLMRSDYINAFEEALDEGCSSPASWYGTPQLENNRIRLFLSAIASY